MSVGLIIRGVPGGPRMVAIAPERVFTDHWQRGAAALRLKLVPCCQTGIKITQKELPLLLEELARLKQWMELPDSEIPQGGVLDHISNLIEELDRLRGSTRAKIWIG